VGDGEHVQQEDAIEGVDGLGDGVISVH
jgi:hypothetical protein